MPMAACATALQRGATPRLTSSVAGGDVRTPLDGAESRVAKEIVGETDSLQRLMPVARAGTGRRCIAARHEVLDADGVGAVHAHGTGRIPTGDDLLSKVVGANSASGAYPGDIVLAPRHLEHDPVAHDKPQPEEHVRTEAIVVIAFGLIGNGADRAQADAAEGCALQGYLAREPPLADGAERDGRGRDAKDLRR